MDIAAHTRVRKKCSTHRTVVALSQLSQWMKLKMHLMPAIHTLTESAGLDCSVAASCSQ